MNELIQDYQSQQPQGGTLAQASSSREMEEVKGQIFMAKQFPRNIFQSEQRILDNCKRESLAKQAVYQYPRGGTKVEGPSIRLAEVLAQNWGNLAFGVKELEQREGESVAMAYAWDLETNVRQEKIFTVKHSRKAKGSIQKLTDPRDIYELVANNGARRVRACILGIIPGDIVDKAVDQCTDTLRGNGDKPLKERISNALNLFKQYRVTQDMIEDKFGYDAGAFTEYDLVELVKIYNSLKDGMSKPDDWFDKDAKKRRSDNSLEDDLKNSGEKPSENNKGKQTDGKAVKSDDSSKDVQVEEGELPFV
ncbi:hypothetical protein HXA31_20320 [Salipaludibacillus agaradhaerens]|jgi:hypothetical protein|uniref:Uncharacterized protein n=1 Tax=Salipaludibacillus agaradhaerens TaxID=76935 RepID=A0A9Q4B231_SALAG|nr:hypothetical protein [Salipaludibacillus agaradhaerens]MCR6096907.1 hypothetical protein [Salipaludibacillus agaradhaerens]MCR6116677.1 hypothetical protein [Salipaludibacillus agaradhaerens]